MYAAALSFPAVPVPRPSSASLARYVMSFRISAVSWIAERGAGAIDVELHAQRATRSVAPKQCGAREAGGGSCVEWETW